MIERLTKAACRVAGITVIAAALAGAPGWAAIADPGNSATGLAALERFQGTWNGQGSFVTTPYSRAATAHVVTTCAWSGDKLFMICQQVVALDGKSDDDVSIYSYDAKKDTYHFFNVGVSRANSVAISVAGDTVTYSSSFTDRSINVLTRTLNTWDRPGHYLWRSEYSIDAGKTWVLMASGDATRT
jgi:hypothetical protein